jgi:hypothetical protein
LAKPHLKYKAGTPSGTKLYLPAFAGNFSNEQIANVVTFVRTHIGNKYRDEVKPDDVKIMRWRAFAFWKHLVTCWKDFFAGREPIRSRTNQRIDQ